uniref:E3 ubiquitin-protein ligase n=1 Tax=Guillardia theta TaxID=55529 RepID=A0A7S4P168_GUITH
MEMVGQGGRKQTIQRLFLRNIQRGLVTLPPLFQDLVRDVYESEGGGGETVSQVAVCLVCGEKIARISSGSVLSYRPCVSHARSCGAGLGIFLLLSKSSVMLVQDLWVAHWGSPFLDQYGEEDFGLLRGHKLFLDAARYSSLNELWNSQNLRRWNANKWKKVEAIP